MNGALLNVVLGNAVLGIGGGRYICASCSGTGLGGNTACAGWRD